MRDNEQRAIEKLIAQINSIELRDNQVGRVIMLLFAIVFSAALTLLVVVASH